MHNDDGWPESCSKPSGVLAVTLLGMLALGIQPLAAQSLDQRAHEVLGLMFHGPAPLESSFRDSVLADTALIEHIASLVRGTRSMDEPWNMGTALWWLAETGDAQYADLFAAEALREAHPDPFAPSYAAYGLARTSKSPVSRAAMQEILATGDERLARQTIRSLQVAGDSSALSLLLEIDPSDVSDRSRAILSRARERSPTAQPGRICIEGDDRVPRDSPGCR